MNRNEALIEARRRWGPAAAISETEHLGLTGATLTRSVGLQFESKGTGPTWEDAFLDASKRVAPQQNGERHMRDESLRGAVTGEGEKS